MGNFVLTPRAPKEYGVETFDTDASIWPETDDTKTDTSRCTSDSTRDSVMRIAGKSWKLGTGKTLGDGFDLGDSPDGQGHGAYKDYIVMEGLRYTFTCLYRMDNGALIIQLYDQSNGAEMSTVYETKTTWGSHETSVVAPDGCSVVRVKFLQSDSDVKPGPFYIDDVSLNGNTLLYDPDRYSRVPERVGSIHQTLAGRRIYDLRAIHYLFHLGWNFFMETQYENLREVYYSNELLYFDDGDVPPLAEWETVYETGLYDYEGITNPSSIHKAYSDSYSSLPSTKSDFEAAEFTTADYQNIDEDDNNYKETADPDADKYIYHKFLLLSSINSQDVRRFRVKIAMSGDDSSPQNLDGGVLYAWNGTSWVELAKNTNSAKTNMTYSTAEAEVANQFVDSIDNYIRLLLRSRNRRSGTNALNLRTYYVECEINEGLDLTVDLSHKCILDENDDVIWVKNLTQGTTLTLGTDYTIANDRRSIAVLGQTSGDHIEVKYDRYFEVMFASIPEEWLGGEPLGMDRSRSVEIVLETLSESK